MANRERPACVSVGSPPSVAAVLVRGRRKGLLAMGKPSHDESSGERQMKARSWDILAR